MEATSLAELRTSRSSRPAGGMHREVACPLRLARLALIAAVAIGVIACASREDGFGRLQPVADSYSRNLVVCIPTGVGNVVGGIPGAVLAVPVFHAIRPFSSDAAKRSTIWLLAPPTLIGGFATGTAFIPFAYLRPEDPCRFAVH